MGVEKAVILCTRALEQFETSVKSSDEYLLEFLQQGDHQLTPSEETLVIQIFEACVTFKKAIKTIVNAFYTSGDTSALRSDRHLYNVLFYLAVLGLEDIGFKAFQRLIVSQHTAKMARFLHFLFGNPGAITGWMKDRWMSVYDEETVNNEFIQPMLQHRERMLELVAALDDPSKLSELRDTLRNRPLSRTRPPANATVPQPFNLTRPKPRVVPLPRVVSTAGPPRSKPIPKTTYITPLEEAALERKREANRRKAEKTVTDALTKTFACAPTAEEVRAKQQILAERKVQDELAQIENSIRARPVPNAVRAAVPVRLNAAAILREEKLYRQQLEEEATRLSKLEAGEFNERELMELQEKIRLEEEQQRLVDIERKILEGQLSHEEAIIARQQAMEQRLEVALDVKEESRRLLERAQRLREKEEEMLRQNAAQIQQIREQVAEAVEEALKQKKEQGQQVKAEREMLMKEAAERAAAEMEQKLEIIRQIKALEAVRPDRAVEFNAAETMNHGLLTEMSFAELQQRLDMLRTLRKEEEEAKRAVIFDAKLAKDTMLQEKVEAIQVGRMQLGMERSQKQTQKAQFAQLARPKSTDEKLSGLREKLAARRAERIQRTSQMPTPLSTRAASRAGGKQRSAQPSRTGTATTTATTTHRSIST
eukprot:m.63842 g.63842  ORF g.63842 m.63842 type:complete len:653 (-) comp13467_c0_seq1:1438-3396(-)